MAHKYYRTDTMHSLWNIFLQVTAALYLSSAVQCSRILMVPLAMGSHFALMSNVARELASRGHHVDIYFTDSFSAPKGIETDLIRYVTFRGNVSADQLNANIVQNVQDAFDLKQDIVASLRKMRNITEQACEDNLIHREQQMDMLESNNYDLAIMDAMMMFKCMYLIPHRLQIPIVSIVDAFEHWIAKLPYFPSVVPHVMMPHTNRMSFKERLVNTFVFIATTLFPVGSPITDEMIRIYSQYGPIQSIDDVVMRTQLWLYTYDAVLDYPEPSMPNILNVGGLAVKPANPLPASLLESIAAWPNGFVVVSFGSGLSYLKPQYATTMIEAFSKLDLLFIWRFENRDELEIPNNVLLMNWLPQNDLLAHEGVRLFITHCGRSGLFEAIHHAVPVIAIPIFGDQPHNARKVQTKGFGEIVDLLNPNSTDIRVKCTKVITDVSYKNNILKASNIFNSRPERPAARAASGIEHILQFGGDHLRSVAFDVPWYQYWMVDIMVLVLVTVHVIMYVLHKCGAMFYRTCCRKSKKEKMS